MLLKIAGLFIALSLFALQQLASLDSTSPWLVALHNSAHLPWFALITWLVCLIVQPKTRTDLLRLSIFLALLAVSSEVLQVFSKRDFSLLDIMANICGGACVLLLYSKLAWRKVLVFVCVAIGLNPVLLVAAAYVERAYYKPEFLPASALLTTHLLSQKSTFGNIQAPESCQGMVGESVHLITFSDRPWPNIRLMDVMADWQEYKSLQLVVCNPAADILNMWVSVHPEDYKGAPSPTYREYFFPKGTHVIDMPINTVMRGNVSRVQDIKIYAHNSEKGKSVIVSSVKLVK